VMVFAAATGLLPLPGCSFVFFDRPSQYKSREKNTCTTSYALPVLDVGFVLLHLVSIAIVSSASGDAYGGEKGRQALTQMELSWLILHAGSAGWGTSWAGECRELVGDADYGARPLSPPRPRLITPPAGASSPRPAQQTTPAQPEPDGPAAAPEAPAPQAPPVLKAPSVPQRSDDGRVARHPGRRPPHASVAQTR